MTPMASERHNSKPVRPSYKVTSPSLASQSIEPTASAPPGAVASGSEKERSVSSSPANTVVNPRAQVEASMASITWPPLIWSQTEYPISSAASTSSSPTTGPCTHGPKVMAEHTIDPSPSYTSTRYWPMSQSSIDTTNSESRSEEH